MPIFETPASIVATISLEAGNLRITASDRTDTVVEVRPSKASAAADVRAAEETLVEYAEGRLSVKAPKSKTRSWLRRGASIEVTIDLPTDSRVEVDAVAGDLRAEGRLGESAFETVSGDIRVDLSGGLRLKTVSGDVAVARSVGRTDVTTANGDVRIGEVEGAAVARTVSGDITVGTVTGDLRLDTTNGDISVDRALAGVSARTQCGDVRIGEVVRGSVVLETASGDLEVGIREGSAAWLDASSQHGDVRRRLAECACPDRSDDTVELRARTHHGDITISRSVSADRPHHLAEA
ncbi:DUF4097 family beta strand repeat-containing protein [Embleya sp. NBC_00896]|uniref:DUF4097 family beta strand repeat-containing protein n=1 Tax=Embleya sp. NBC_00896 TaxID=2975961 RepID=UPI002F90E434|nr:DUF4097 domain-containing protein [Embleya sp. NBC_00896]